MRSTHGSPRKLLILFVAVAFGSYARLLQQDRKLDTHRSAGHREQGAGNAVPAIDRGATQTRTHLCDRLWKPKSYTAAARPQASADWQRLDRSREGGPTPLAFACRASTKSAFTRTSATWTRLTIILQTGVALGCPDPTRLPGEGLQHSLVVRTACALLNEEGTNAGARDRSDHAGNHVDA